MYERHPELKQKNTLSIHIRRGDCFMNPDIHPIANEIYVEIDETFSGGVLSVTGKTYCGETSSSSIYVDILPQEPEFVIFEKNCDKDKTYEFAVTNVEDVKFTWKTPESASITKGQGSSNVKIKFGKNFKGGNIEVYAENSCGAGLVSSMLINEKD
jgi:hypothetical protein